MEFTKEQIAFLKGLVRESSRIFIIPEQFNTAFEKKAYSCGIIDSVEKILMGVAIIKIKEK